MGWCHQVEIMTTLFLQVQHHIGQPFRANAVSQPTLAERKVLTIGTACLTVAKENGARASCSANRWLFAAMDVPRRYDSFGAGMTDAGLTGDAVATAVLGTDGATA